MRYPLLNELRVHRPVALVLLGTKRAKCSPKERNWRRRPRALRAAPRGVLGQPPSSFPARIQTVVTGVKCAAQRALRAGSRPEFGKLERRRAQVSAAG